MALTDPNAAPDQSGNPDAVVESRARAIPDWTEVAPVATAGLKKLDEREGQLDSSQVRLNADVGLEAEARARDLEAPRQALSESVTSFADKARETPQLQDAPDPPPKSVIDPEKFQQFGAIAFPFLLLLGKTMRANGVQALDALSSSVQGYIHGSQEQSKQNFQVFKAKFEQVMADNKKKLNEYEAILKRADLDTSQKQILLNIAAQKHDDMSFSIAAQQKSLGDQFKEIQKQRESMTKVGAQEVAISKDFEDNYTKNEDSMRRARSAQERIKMMVGHKGDAVEERKRQFFYKQQLTAHKEFAFKIAQLDKTPMPPGIKAGAERRLREEYAFQMKTINDMARADGLGVPAQNAIQENPDFDSFGKFQLPDDGQKQQSWAEWIKGVYGSTFGQPGNAAVPQPGVSAKPAPVQPQGGVVDFNSLPQ